MKRDSGVSTSQQIQQISSSSGIAATAGICTGTMTAVDILLEFWLERTFWEKLHQKLWTYTEDLSI